MLQTPKPYTQRSQQPASRGLVNTSKNTSGSVAIAVVMLIIMVGHTRNMALRVPLHAATSVQGSSGGGLMARVGEYYHWYCYYYYVPLLLVEIAIVTVTTTFAITIVCIGMSCSH